MKKITIKEMMHEFVQEMVNSCDENPRDVALQQIGFIFGVISSMSRFTEGYEIDITGSCGMFMNLAAKCNAEDHRNMEPSRN